MNRKLLPTMIGAALAGGMSMAAQADVTVFGHIDTSIDAVDVDNGKDDTNLNCTTCSIGFKGSEDLGNGLKAIFSLDFQYDTTERNNGVSGSITTKTDSFVTKVAHTKNGSPTTTGTKAVTSVSHSNSGKDAFFDRDQWLGLAGSFGKVRIGTISTLYKSHGAMIDPLYRTSLQARDRGIQSKLHSGAGEEIQGRATNTIRWDSPSFNGLQVGAHYTLDNDEGDGEDDDPFGVGVSYSNGGILVFADYLDNNQGTSSGETEKTAWKVGGKFSMNNVAVMAQYEDFEENTSSADDEFTLWHVAGTYTMGNNMIYAAYAQGNEEYGSSYDEDWDSWTIAGVHSMSKRTSVYAGYSTTDCDSDLSVNVCSDATYSNGGDNDQFSVGMKHKF